MSFPTFLIILKKLLGVETSGVDVDSFQKSRKVYEKFGESTTNGVDLYKEQTNKQTEIVFYIYRLAVVPVLRYGNWCV